jgi:hypothetical protein
MNELNTASIEASKKLYEAGIVLETDCIWCQYIEGFRLIAVTELHPLVEVIPAPCFTDVWKELPWYVLRDDVNCQLQIEKYNTFTSAYYDGTGQNYTSENPTDALIDLLIWVKGQEVV